MLARRHSSSFRCRNDFGVWIRMECPFGTGFNSGSQSCGPNFAHLPANSSVAVGSVGSTLDFRKRVTPSESEDKANIVKYL